MRHARTSLVRTSGISPVCLVCLVHLVSLVHLVHLVDLVYLVGLVQPKKRDKPNKQNNGLLTLEDFFSILLDDEEGEAKYVKSEGHLALLTFNR